MLSELIADELEYDIMVRLYGKLSGPWIIRNKLRDWSTNAIDSMIMAAVKPAWGGVRKAVEELRHKVEPTIRQMSEAIFKAEIEIVAQMKESVMSVLEPLLNNHVTPHLQDVVAIIKSPMRDAVSEALTLFDDKISKWQAGNDMERSFRDLDYFAKSYWQLYPAMKKVDELYEPLWLLRDVFRDIYPWSLIWKGHDTIYKHVDNAVYTWEQSMLKERNRELADPIKRDVIVKFRQDTDLALVRYYRKILRLIILPPFEAAVHPVAQRVIEPLAKSIPEPLREFIDVKQMFEDLYTGIVNDSINVVLQADRFDDVGISRRTVNGR